MHIERILCPIDFSEFSVKAYDYAQSLAKHYQSTLFLQHIAQFVVPDYAYYAAANSIPGIFDMVQDNARIQMRNFAESHTRTGVQPKCIVHDGVVTDSILSFAEAQKVNLIVMGTHGVKGVERVILGSVTEKVLRKSRCPVLVIPKPAHDVIGMESDQDPIQLKKIVFCTDFSDHSYQALEYALSIAVEYGAELALLHVLDDIGSSAHIEDAIATATKQLDKLIPPEAVKAGKIKTMVRIGRAFEQIIQFALEIQADLLIMAVHGRNALDLAVFGSTTYRVIQLGSCPVLAVHV